MRKFSSLLIVIILIFSLNVVGTVDNNDSFKFRESMNILNSDFLLFSPYEVLESDQPVNNKLILKSINFQGGPQEEWNNTYGGRYFDYILDGEITNDGGYISCGSTRSLSNSNGDNEDGWLLKIDNFGNEIWNRTFDNKGVDVLARIHQTNDNGYILNGWTVSLDDEYLDSWIVKTDENGVEIWNNTYGGIYRDYSNSNLVESNDGGYLLSGFTNSYGGFQGDVWILKISSNGDELWNKTFGGNQLDYGVEIIPGLDDGYIILGNTYSYGEGDSDCWIIKIDDEGNEQWSKTFGGNFYDRGRSIIIAGDNGYIVLGSSNFVIEADNDFFYLDNDIWVFKIDLLGNMVWEKTIGDRFFDETGNSIQISSDSGYIISGRMDHKSNGKIDGLLMKIDDNGNVEWKKIFGGSENQVANTIIQIENGNYVIFGWTNSYGMGDFDAWIVSFSYFENERPNVPDKPIGPTSSKILIECEYSCIGTEPEEQQIYYLFNWGDNYDSG